MKITKSAIKGLDLFAIPFQFSFEENEKGKKTFIGGILSILIGVASLSYFAYLCYLYWDNKIAPSTSIIEQYSTESLSLNLDPETYAIQVLLSDRQNLQDYQDQTNTILLHIIGMFSQINDEGNPQLDQVLASPCKSQELKGYYCFTFSKNPFGANLTSQQGNNIQLSLIFSRCIPNYLSPNQKCESDTSIIQKKLISLKADITIKFILKQYNSNIKKIVNRTAIENFFFDDNNSFITFLNLKKSDSTINDGFFLQKSSTDTFLSSYDRNNQVVSKNSIVQQLGFEAYGGIIFLLAPNFSELQITFPQFTYVLAQFSSVFNSLLFIGFLSKIFAESEIYHEMMALQLQIYYKATALQLLTQSQIPEIKINKSKGKVKFQKKDKDRKQEPQIKLIPPSNNNNNNNNNTNSLNQKEVNSFCKSPLFESNQANNQVFKDAQLLTENPNELVQEFNLESPNLQKYTDEVDENIPITLEKASSTSTPLLLSFFKNIKQLNFKTFFSQKMKISSFTRIFSILFPSNQSTNKSQDNQIYQNLQGISSNALNVFELYKEILTFKIMLRLLLSPDQYAAALLCGSKISLNKEEKMKSQKYLQNDQNENNERKEQELIPQNINIAENKLSDKIPSLNHLEKIDKIEQNEIYLEFYLQNFLSKLKNEPHQLSEIDLRIRDSMIGFLN